jgi:hypothetical protein
MDVSFAGFLVCVSGLTQLIQCKEYRFAVNVSTCNNLPSNNKKRHEAFPQQQPWCHTPGEQLVLKFITSPESHGILRGAQLPQRR